MIVDETRQNLKEYYGTILHGTKDLKTDACCCSTDSMSLTIREALALIDDEIVEKFYGCGSPIPDALKGRVVLDLGCGTGRDVYVASQLVGPEGFVIGVDMTDEQLNVARKHINSQMERFGYERPNVAFKKGYIENLKDIDYRVVENRKFDINNTEIDAKIGMIDFYSMTIRAFKLDCLEDICEDYGQVATYLGTIADHPHAFELDDHHRFVTGKPMLVCGNTAAMVQDTRFAPHFKVMGDRSVHYGPFDCGAPAVTGDSADSCGC